VPGLMAIAASWPSARADFERVSNRICHLISAQSAVARVHWDVIVWTLCPSAGAKYTQSPISTLRGYFDY
jgi:hypothetical protein